MNLASIYSFCLKTRNIAYPKSMPTRLDINQSMIMLSHQHSWNSGTTNCNESSRNSNAVLK